MNSYLPPPQQVLSSAKKEWRSKLKDKYLYLPKTVPSVFIQSATPSVLEGSPIQTYTNVDAAAKVMEGEKKRNFAFVGSKAR